MVHYDRKPDNKVEHSPDCESQMSQGILGHGDKTITEMQSFILYRSIDTKVVNTTISAWQNHRTPIHLKTR